jgi:hypothetical protein
MRNTGERDLPARVAELAEQVGGKAVYEADQVSSEAVATAETFRDKFRRNPLPYLLYAGGVLVVLVIASRQRHGRR